MRTAPARRATEGPPPEATLTLAQSERAHILRACEASGWRIKGRGGAAERLQLNPSTVYFRMRKLDIARPS